MADEVRVTVAGTGLMGLDHVERLATRVSGARVTGLIEPDEGRAARAKALAPGAVAFARIEDAIAAGAQDAIVLATPSAAHEQALLPAIAAGVPTLCEKPLSVDAESSFRIVTAESEAGKRLIQVGFMRRFDAGYLDLKRLIDSGEVGELLLLKCSHRNASTPPGFTQRMIITDSAVHELDVVPWLTGQPIKNVAVRESRRDRPNAVGLREPVLLTVELQDGLLVSVELTLNAQYGYQVVTEAVFERGVATIGRTAGMELQQAGRLSVSEHQDFRTRFKDAYDSELQQWIDCVRLGEVNGPTAWDGYLASVACEAGVAALNTSAPVAVSPQPRPALYD